MDTLRHRIAERVRLASREFGLLADGDRVLVAVSGGKDSLCMLEMLAMRSRIAAPRFAVEAVHVRMENVDYAADTSWLQAFADGLGVPLHIVSTGFEWREGSRKPACFLCSWHRRKAIFRLAQDLGCNKIALGHHNDDIVHTALMNLLYQGSFATMPAKLQLRRMPLTIVRPLCTVEEADIAEYARLAGWPKLDKACPYEHESKRTAVRALYSDIESISPDARHSIWNALRKAGMLVQEEMRN